MVILLRQWRHWLYNGDNGGTRAFGTNDNNCASGDKGINGSPLSSEDHHHHHIHPWSQLASVSDSECHSRATNGDHYWRHWMLGAPSLLNTSENRLKIRRIRYLRKIRMNT
jgi:hypothetical protein